MREIVLLVCGSVLLSACGAVYPEMKTPVRKQAANESVDSDAPRDLYSVYFEGAQVPLKTRDGRDWRPNPYAKLIVDGRELLVTSTQSRTNKPTWPDQKPANYRIGSEQEVVIEVWDDQPVVDPPICRERILRLASMAEGGRNVIDCTLGARVWLGVEPARAWIGAGLYYELRGADGVRVTRVVGESPAARLGLKTGDRILSIQGDSVAGMDALKVRGRINALVSSGVRLEIVTEAGEAREVTLKEGPIYPLGGEDQSWSLE